MRRSGSGSGSGSGCGSGSGSARILQLLALVCWAVLLGRAEDDELTVEESTERTREKVTGGKKEADRRFSEELFEGIDPSRLGETKKLSMDDFVVQDPTGSRRNESEVASDSNRCGRALECGDCLAAKCAWCLATQRCTPDVIGADHGCPAGPDEHISSKDEWTGLKACPSYDALKCDECRAIAHQVAAALTTRQARPAVAKRSPPRLTELELLDLFEDTACVEEAFGSYGARVNSTSGELQLAGPGVAGELLDSELTNEGFKKAPLARHCRELTSDELDESEIYGLFVGGGEEAVRAAICEADCGKKAKKKKKKKSKKKKKGKSREL